MSTAHDHDGFELPQFEMGDRLRLAIHARGFSVQEVADHLEVSRNTISNWTAGRSYPRPRDVKALCLLLAVPREWLEDGVTPSYPNGSPSEKRRTGERPLYAVA